MGVTSGMVKLAGNLGAVDLNGFRQLRETGNELIIADADHIRSPAELIDGAASDDDHSGSPLSALYKIVGVVGEKAPVSGGKKMHGRHDDTVFQFHPVDFDGGKEHF
jgi:hypothetical protein